MITWLITKILAPAQSVTGPLQVGQNAVNCGSGNNNQHAGTITFGLLFRIKI